MSNPASCTIRAAHEGWRQEGEPLGYALLDSAAYLPLVQRNTGGFCAGRVGDKQGKGSHCKVPGFQRFPTKVLGDFSPRPKEEGDLKRVPAVRMSWTWDMRCTL